MQMSKWIAFSERPSNLSEMTIRSLKGPHTSPRVTMGSDDTPIIITCVALADVMLRVLSKVADYAPRRNTAPGPG